MMVLVDTPVWSLALRRGATETGAHERATRNALEELVTGGRAALLGVVRQEILSGIREETQYHRLRKSLRAFPDVNLTVEDFEEAARIHNICRFRGVAGGTVDFLICAAALRRNWPIFTLDRDFLRYSRHISIKVHAGGRKACSGPSVLGAAILSTPPRQHRVTGTPD